MTTKDFVVVAEIVKGLQLSPADRGYVVRKFADGLKKTNPKFNEKLFIEAASGEFDNDSSMVRSNDTLESVELTKEQKDFVAFAVNHFGSGQHPWASNENVKFFAKKYAVECVKKAIEPGGSTQTGVDVGRSVLTTLGLSESFAWFVTSK